MVLLQCEYVVVTSGKVFDEYSPGEHCRFMLRSLRDEAICDATLVENLDGAREQTACAMTGEILVGAPLYNNDVHLR